MRRRSRAGDSTTAEKFVLPQALETHRQAAAEIARDPAAGQS